MATVEIVHAVSRDFKIHCEIPATSRIMYFRRWFGMYHVSLPYLLTWRPVQVLTMAAMEKRKHRRMKDPGKVGAGVSRQRPGIVKRWKLTGTGA